METGRPGSNRITKCADDMDMVAFIDNENITGSIPLSVSLHDLEHEENVSLWILCP